MRKQFICLSTKAQAAIEYMLLLAAVVSIVLVGFKNFLPSFQLTSNYYFNQVGIGVLDEPNRCGDDCCGVRIQAYGGCTPHYSETPDKCPTDCR